MLFNSNQVSYYELNKNSIRGFIPKYKSQCKDIVSTYWTNITVSTVQTHYFIFAQNNNNNRPTI